MTRPRGGVGQARNSLGTDERQWAVFPEARRLGIVFLDVERTPPIDVTFECAWARRESFRSDVATSHHSNNDDDDEMGGEEAQENEAKSFRHAGGRPSNRAQTTNGSNQWAARQNADAHVRSARAWWRPLSGRGRCCRPRRATFVCAWGPRGARMLPAPNPRAGARSGLDPLRLRKVPTGRRKRKRKSASGMWRASAGAPLRARCGHRRRLPHPSAPQLSRTGISLPLTVDEGLPGDRTLTSPPTCDHLDDDERSNCTYTRAQTQGAESRRHFLLGQIPGRKSPGGRGSGAPSVTPFYARAV